MDALTATWREVKDTPLGTIYIKTRLCRIEATVRGKRVFFVTTHLEREKPLPGDPEAAFLPICAGD